MLKRPRNKPPPHKLIALESDATKNLNLASEPVPDLPHRDDVPRLRRIRLELPPQFGHVGINRATHDERAVTPHLGQQILAGCDGAVPAQQRQQQVVRLGSEVTRLPVSTHRP